MSEPYPFPAVDAADPIHQVIVIRPQRPRYFLAGALLLITLFTTLVMGARLQYNFEHHLAAFSLENDFFPVGWAILDWHNLLLGLPFAATLVGILLVHELGHYVGCRHYHVNATLPYFIPAPTLIGTFGAFIRIKSMIPSRRALFDVGIAGPIAGFVVAVPMTLIGLLLSQPQTANQPPSDLHFGLPLIFYLMSAIGGLFSQRLASTPLSAMAFHPIAIAAWVGMFATGLNLIPAGQLDGGHILYASLPQFHRYLSRLLAIAMVVLSFTAFATWLLVAIFLAWTRFSHPPVPMYPELNSRRRVLAAVALLIFVLTFVPVPFHGSTIPDIVRQVAQQLASSQ